MTTKRRLSDANTDQSNKTLKSEDKEQRLEQMFENMRLRRIVKENHGCDINQLSFFFNNKNFTAPFGLDQVKTFDKRGAVQRHSTDTSNVLATVGGCELSIYDNEHCGDHLDIMSNFDLTPLEEEGDNTAMKHTLDTFCWLYKERDAVLATGGADGLIHIISVANSEEIKILEGHQKRIYDIQSHPQSDNIILSTSKDGTIRLWDVDEGKCIAIFEAEATVTCFHPAGEKFVSGNSRGELRVWKIPSTTETMDDEPIIIEKKDSRPVKKMHGDSYIDCIRFANGNVLSKSINGRIEYWDMETEQTIRSIRIRSGENYSRFDVSLDELFFCVGSSQGTVYVYNIKSGKVVSELGHRRSTKAVRCCVFSRDSRQIISAGEDGFIMRYDYIDDDTLAEWKNWTKDDL
ncbi:WD40-repeat-containing domain protein [Pilaira anomala]|nr:WD40-repeat-containing domain protein [Pilaira anomala]